MSSLQQSRWWRPLCRNRSDDLQLKTYKKTFWVANSTAIKDPSGRQTTTNWAPLQLPSQTQHPGVSYIPDTNWIQWEKITDTGETAISNEYQHDTNMLLTPTFETRDESTYQGPLPLHPVLPQHEPNWAPHTYLTKMFRYHCALVHLQYMHRKGMYNKP